MLFNKQGQGSLEIYKLTGTFQASTPFPAIQAEIEAATSEVANVVGTAIIDAAQTAYNNGDKPDFVAAVQRPIACLAIWQYSKLTGVSHGDTGRKIKVDEGEKVPFEWMLDRDDREMRERYYRSLDLLFRFLKEHDIPGWSGKDKKSKCIVKSIEEFEMVYPLEHSYYMFDKMIPLMEEVQSQLENIIGMRMSEQLTSGENTNFTLLARRFVVLKALILAVERWSLEAFPLAIARRFSPSYQGNRESHAATTTEIDWYLRKLSAQVRDITTELQTIIKGNPYEGVQLLPKNDPKNKFFTS